MIEELAICSNPAHLDSSDGRAAADASTAADGPITSAAAAAVAQPKPGNLQPYEYATAAEGAAEPGSWLLRTGMVVVVCGPDACIALGLAATLASGGEVCWDGVNQLLTIATPFAFVALPHSFMGMRCRQQHDNPAPQQPTWLNTFSDCSWPMVGCWLETARAVGTGRFSFFPFLKMSFGIIRPPLRDSVC